MGEMGGAQPRWPAVPESSPAEEPRTPAARRGPGRAVSRVAGDGGIEPRVAGSGPDQAIGPGLAQRLAGRRLAAPRRLPPAGLLARRGARGDPGREPRVQRRRRQPRGQPGLQLIGVQQRGRRPSVDALGGSNTPVRGLRRVPYAASTS